MSSHDSTIVMDLGLSRSFTPSIDTSALGVNHTFDNSLPSSSLKNFETMVANILQDDIIQINEDLENLQNQLSTKNISTTAIPTIDNIHRMIESEEGVELVRNLAQIFGKLIPTTSCSQNSNKIQNQGGTQINPPTTITSIPTYTNLKLQQQCNLIVV